MNPSSIVGHVTELCERIDKSTQPSDAVAGTFFRDRRYLGSRDRRAIGEAVFGILRHRRYIETLLEAYEDTHTEFKGPDLSSRYLPLYVIYALACAGNGREAIAEGTGSRWAMFYPAFPLADVLSWVEQHADLTQFSLDADTFLGVKYSFQDWMIRELRGAFGERLEALLTSLNTPATTTIRINTLKADRDDCKKRLLAEGIETELAPHSPSGLHLKKRFDRHTSAAFKDGWFEIQDEGSQLVSFFASPAGGQFVIDGCAGAGGKSLHLAELMGNTGEIYAIDSERRRLEELNIRAARAGVGIIRVKLLSDINPEGFAGKADLVLVDVPCSGSGTIRRNPSLKWTVTEQSVIQYASRQLEILEYNAGFVRPGGSLCYATCSIFRRENEDVVRAFLERHPDFSVDMTEIHVQGSGISFTDGTMRLSPHQHGTDGFFAARLRRSDGVSAG
jgi:16S rRNA (cytosine967-C5)-methyltransferase